jgi:hypothetical protein
LHYGEPLTAADTLRELKGMLYDYDLEAGEVDIAGRPVYVRYPTRRSGDIHGDTGAVVWDGSVVLAKYLEWQSRLDPPPHPPLPAAATAAAAAVPLAASLPKEKDHAAGGGEAPAAAAAAQEADAAPPPPPPALPPPCLVRGRRVLELGAGVGFVGLACAALGAAEVVVTDLAYTHDALRAGAAASEAAWSQLEAGEEAGQAEQDREEEEEETVDVRQQQEAVDQNAMQVPHNCRRGRRRRRESPSKRGVRVCELDWFSFPDLARTAGSHQLRGQASGGGGEEEEGGVEEEEQENGDRDGLLAPFDLIVGAEVFWLTHLMQPLMDTLEALFNISPKVCVAWSVCCWHCLLRARQVLAVVACAPPLLGATGNGGKQCGNVVLLHPPIRPGFSFPTSRAATRWTRRFGSSSMLVRRPIGQQARGAR